MVSFSLLGGASLEDESGPIKGPATHRHRLALLALLVMSRDQGLARDRLVAVLWPDRDAKRGRNLLNQAVHALRRTLKAEAIASAADELRLAPGFVTCDVAAFEAAMDADHPEEAVRRYAGPFLDGFHLSGAPEFDAWVDRERERLKGIHARALEAVAEEARLAGHPAGAVEWWRRLSHQEPHNARITLRFMEALLEVGDRAGAIQQARTHARMVERDLGAAPDPAVLHLAEEIRGSRMGETGARLSDSQSSLHSHGIPDDHPRPLARDGPEGGSPSPPFVGRSVEVDRLQVVWRETGRKGPHLALITGEAGIGKTRLAQEFLQWAVRRGVTVGRSRCYAAEGGIAFAPVADWLRSDALRPSLAELDPGTIAELARLLPELVDQRAARGSPPPAEGWERQRFFASLAQTVLGDGGGRILLVDDLQWCDPDTIQWLRYLLRFERSAHLVVMGTARTEELVADHPVNGLLADLDRHGQVTEVPLGPLSEEDTGRLASRVAGRTLSGEVTARIWRDTEGNPFFVVETVQADLTESDEALSGQEPGVGVLQSLSTPGGGTVPARVRMVIRSRFRRLSPGGRSFLEVAAVTGRDFTFELLLRAGKGSEDACAGAVEELCSHRIVREQGPGHFDFTHDRLREEAYQGAGSARRILLHRRTARALEELYGTQAHTASGEIATHWELGGLTERALPYYALAADAAMGTLAYEKAAAHLIRALALLETLPEGTERDRRELSLTISLVPTLRLTRGWAAPQVGETLARARMLCRRLGDPPEVFQVLVGLQSFHFVRGTDLELALEVLEETRPVALSRGDPLSVVAVEFQAGSTLCQVGRFAAALECVDRAVALYDPGRDRTGTSFYGGDFGVLSHAFAGHLLWHLGHPEQALERSRTACQQANELEHPFSQAVARAYHAMLLVFLDAPAAAARWATSALELSEEHGFAYYEGWGRLILGWSHAQGEQVQEGIRRMRLGLSAIEGTGAQLRRPYYLGLVAEALGRCGRFNEGLRLVDEALATSARSGERWKDAENLRIRGELLFAREREVRGEPTPAKPENEAEKSFREALRVARRQCTRALELRAAVVLAELLAGTGRGKGGGRILEPIFASFEEGFDTPDLQRAHRTLETLTGSVERG